MTMRRHGVAKIVSGGQTGVDRGALDAAMKLGLEHGGWCPKGRLAEDGQIPACYQLIESDAREYSVRTEQNILDSDGTLILYAGRLQGGTALTNRLAQAHNKPLLRIRIERVVAYDRIVRWLRDNRIQVLNVAGPRGSSNPRLQQQVREILVKLFNATDSIPHLDP